MLIYRLSAFISGFASALAEKEAAVVTGGF